MNLLYVCQDHGIPVLGSKGSSVHVREMIAALHRSGHAGALVAPAANKSIWDQPAAVEGRKQGGRAGTSRGHRTRCTIRQGLGVIP